MSTRRRDTRRSPSRCSLLLTLPWWVGNTYYINIASQILLFAVFALALNVLVGYAGLVSLGHAGLFAIAGYTAALMLQGGYGHLAANSAAIVVTLAASAIFAVLALRSTGIGFLMITLALGQIIWGVAYRWASLTGGDNGVNVTTRPAPFGLSLSNAPSFYIACLIVFLLALATMVLFVRSPFGASLRGTRDQARRMNALGYNVWLIRFLAIVFSGFWTGISGLLFIYYNQFVSPQVSALTASAEVLLMVISGGTATLLGPIAGAVIVVVMKNVVSAYVERWNLVLGVIFIVIITFMPEGLVPGTVRLWRWCWHRIARHAASRRGRQRPAEEAHTPRCHMTALAVNHLSKSFGGLRVTADVNLAVAPGERRLIIGPNGAGKTTLFNLITGEIAPDSGSVVLFDRDITRMPSHRRPHLGMARTYQIITLFDKDTILRNVTLALLGLSPLRWSVFTDIDHQHAISSCTPATRSRASASRISPSARCRRPPMASADASRSPWRWRKVPEVLLLDEPFAGTVDRRAARRAHAAQRHPARGDDRDDRAQHGRRARLGGADHASALR